MEFNVKITNRFLTNEVQYQNILSGFAILVGLVMRLKVQWLINGKTSQAYNASWMERFAMKLAIKLLVFSKLIK